MRSALMAKIKPGSAKLVITSHPKVAPVTAAGGLAILECSDITATGSVMIEGGAAKVSKFGFMQVGGRIRTGVGIAASARLMAASFSSVLARLPAP